MNLVFDPDRWAHGLRQARASDYDAVISVVDAWWGRPMTALLPRLFFDHFHTSSLIATTDDESLAAFLVGFVSPSVPEQAYIHFVGVAPAQRGAGWARRMYEVFCDAAARAGCREVSCVTSPINETSMAFHRAMGFTVTGPHHDYDGPGKTLMRMRLSLASGSPA